jgi:hypothetical protein
VPLLRITRRLILGIDIRFHNTSSWTGVVRGGLPRAAHEFHPPQLLENNATPILRRAERPQTALALAAALITKDTKLPQPIAAKSMRAKLPREVFVYRADRLFIRYRRPDQPVHVLHRLDSCLDDAHPIFTIPLTALSL